MFASVDSADYCRGNSDTHRIEAYYMNTVKYQVFLTVAELGSLTAAGDRLGYTQSGVSRIIADMEVEFGFPLFTRSKGGAALTADGAKLIAPMREVINSDELLRQTVSAINGLLSGRVRVGMFSSVAVHWAPDIICGFNRLYPSIDIEIFAGLYQEIEEMILDERLDCGFITKSTHKDLNSIALTRDKMLAVLPKGHPFEGFDALPIDLISGDDFIIPGEGSNYDIGQLFGANGITPKVRYTLRDDYAAIAMVERGIGITILPELVLSGHDENVTTLELCPACFRTIGIASRPHKGISPAARAFVDYVRSWASARQNR